MATEMINEANTTEEFHLPDDAIDRALTAVMMVDKDLKIIFANQATLAMLGEHETVLQQSYPTFSVRTLVGSNIDMFHKNPAHQRRLLADPSNLPHRAEIKLGPLSFMLNVSALMRDNQHVGSMLEWTDITSQKLALEETNAQLSAIDKAMAVIQFTPDGIILEANENFLHAAGYQLSEVVGQHHRIFVDKDYAKSAEYTQFWNNLGAGRGDSGEYRRMAKDGKEIWLQASYNPILDLQGKVVKVIKYATDITEQKVLADNVESVLSSVSKVMNAMSEGDLTETMEGSYEGEFAAFQQTVNGTLGKIAGIVVDINETCTSLASAASEISQGNLDLSQRTEEQASSLEETASSMEELTSTVQQNSENTRQAEKLAANARELAEKGGVVLKAAIEAMSQINSSSKKVADIIGVIDEIAFQTNLLALNAAVEAARAGEQGRGFAVVAAEVRNLAQRSATAAKEIKGLINDSGEKVTEGSKLVNQSGETLEEIVVSAKKVGDIISEIAAASDEQSSGIAQINKAITQMDEMTQQNASLVEEAAAASKSMDEQTQDMQQMLTFFYTGDSAPEPEVPMRRSNRAAQKQTQPHNVAGGASKRAPADKPTRPRASPAGKRQQTDEEWEEF